MAQLGLAQLARGPSVVTAAVEPACSRRRAPTRTAAEPSHVCLTRSPARCRPVSLHSLHDPSGLACSFVAATKGAAAQGVEGAPPAGTAARQLLQPLAGCWAAAVVSGHDRADKSDDTVVRHQCSPAQAGCQWMCAGSTMGSRMTNGEAVQISAIPYWQPASRPGRPCRTGGRTGW